MAKALTKDHLHYIGFIRKAGGFHGELILAIENGTIEDYQDTNFFFIELEGKPVPFAAKATEVKRSDFVVKFEDVDDERTAKKLLSKKVFVEQKENTDTEEELTWTDLIGYIAIDSTAGKLGEIKTVEEYPQQWLATCVMNDKEVLLPLNNETVSEIDEESRTVYLDLPEGLIDLYLE